MRVEAGDRKSLEQLCRAIIRPALPGERVPLDDAGQMEPKLETPRRDGTTHRVMSPLEFMRHGPDCGTGELKVIAAILERPVIEKILTHLGLNPQPVPRGPARQAGQA